MAILMLFALLALLCWAVFNLAVYAVPVFAGVSAGIFAYHTGAGPVGAIIVGCVAAGLTLALAQLLLASVRSPWLVLLIALLFAAPAAFAGYHIVLGIARASVESSVWRQVFAMAGAVVVGATAVVRLIGLSRTVPVASRP